MKSDKTTKKVIMTTFVSGFIALIIVIGALGSSYFLTNSKTIPSDNTSAVNNFQNIANDTHAHATMVVSIDGKILDFSGKRFQNKDLLMHFEGSDGTTVHKHSRSAWLGPFFNSLNMTFEQNCIILYNGSQYCNSFENELTFLVNGQNNAKFQHYIPKDGDRIVIDYGKAKRV